MFEAKMFSDFHLSTFLPLWKATWFVFYSQNPEIALSYSKAANLNRNNLKVFEISKNADTVLNFSYLAKFQISGGKTARFGTSSVS